MLDVDSLGFNVKVEISSTPHILYYYIQIPILQLYLVSEIFLVLMLTHPFRRLYMPALTLWIVN
jgi:hypothetical protein